MGQKSFASFVLIQTLVKVVTSQAQPSLAQYLQLAGLGQHASPPAPSSSGPSYTSAPNYHPPSYQSSSYQDPPKSALPFPLTAIANLAASIPVSNSPLPKPPSVPNPCESLPTTGLDSNVLNNLAIALQLLIVSNILNMPSETTESFSKLELPKFDTKESPREFRYESVPIAPLPLSYPVKSPVSSIQTSIPYLEAPRPQSVYAYESQTLPNANFLGSSGFVEPNIMASAVSGRPNPRSSLTLMSPYEALGPNSPFSDPILSTVYSPGYSKKDFKSPYASILATDGNRDLFSIADLF